MSIADHAGGKHVNQAPQMGSPACLHPKPVLRCCRIPARNSSTASMTAAKCGFMESASRTLPSTLPSATARMIARLYDALYQDQKEEKGILTCPTEWGGFAHRYFQAPRSAEELVAGRDAIAAWARITYGWLGRSSDYKAAFLATLGANAEFYAPYQENARRWYRYSQERVPS